MIRLVFKVVKKIIFGMLLLFAYNTFLSSLNVMIPINIFTIIIVSFLDVPAIIGLILFFLLNY